MEVSMSSLLRTSLYALILGGSIGALYDCVRILRVLFGVSEYTDRKRFEKVYSRGLCNVFKSARGGVFSIVFVALTDILFFISSSCAFVLFLYCFNYGIFRWFILLSCIAGFRIYYLTFGKVVISFSGMIADVLKLLINFAVFAAVSPLKFLLRSAVRVFNKTLCPLIRNIRRAIDKRRSVRYTLKCIESLSDFVLNG